MIVVVVVLALVALLLLAASLVLRRRLAAQRGLTQSSLDRANTLADELSATSTDLAGVRTELAGVQAALDTAQTELAAVQAELTGAQAELVDVRNARSAAESEARTLRRATPLDPEVLWSLERSRSERTWRVSVAPSPEVRSTLADAPNPLVEALQIELDATREEVGTVVSLDAELPATVTAAGSLLTLRVAQELLATVVRRAEETVLRVRADGGDVVITVEATDENGERVVVEVLDLPASERVEQTEHGAVVHGVVLPD